MTDWTDGMGIKRKSVEKWSIWVLPDDRYEEGFYACVIGDIVAEITPCPYIFDDFEGNGRKAMLPIFWFTVESVRGATLGTTWANRCVPMQRAINALFSKQTEDGINSRQLLMVDESMRGKSLLDGQAGRLFLPTEVTDPNRIRYLNPAALDPSLNAALQQNINALFQTSGFSESTIGNADAAQSGRAMAYQQQLDVSKHSGTFKSLEVMIKNFWDFALKVVQTRYETPKQIAIGGGKDNFSFKGADIQGITIRLEPRKEVEGTRAGKLEKAQQQVAAGFAPPESLAAVNPTLESSGFRLLAKKLLDRLIAGEDVNIGPETVAPEAILKEIDERINYFYLRGNQTMVDRLLALKEQLMLDLNSLQSPDAETAAPAPPPTAGSLPEDIQSETAQPPIQ